MAKSTSIQGIRNRIRQLTLFESLSRNLKNAVKKWWATITEYSKQNVGYVWSVDW